MAHTGKEGMIDSETGGAGWSQVTQDLVTHIRSKGKSFKHIQQVCDIIKFISKKSLTDYIIKNRLLWVNKR